MYSVSPSSAFLLVWLQLTFFNTEVEVLFLDLFSCFTILASV